MKTVALLALISLGYDCTRVDGSPNIDLQKLEEQASVKYERTVIWPSVYNPALIELSDLKSRGRWDEVIRVYTGLLLKPDIQASPDLKADIFASVGHAYLSRSKGKDVDTYLLYLSLALASVGSNQVRHSLVEEMAGISMSLDRPDLANYWRAADHYGH